MTGTVHQLVMDEGGQPGIATSDGLEIIDRCAARMRSMLAVFAEHHGDEELVFITEFLAITALAIASDCGVEDVFFEGLG